MNKLLKIILTMVVITMSYSAHALKVSCEGEVTYRSYHPNSTTIDQRSVSKLNDNILVTIENNHIKIQHVNIKMHPNRSEEVYFAEAIIKMSDGTYEDVSINLNRLTGEMYANFLKFNAIKSNKSAWITGNRFITGVRYFMDCKKYSPLF